MAARDDIAKALEGATAEQKAAILQILTGSASSHTTPDGSAGGSSKTITSEMQSTDAPVSSSASQSHAEEQSTVVKAALGIPHEKSQNRQEGEGMQDGLLSSTPGLETEAARLVNGAEEASALDPNTPDKKRKSDADIESMSEETKAKRQGVEDYTYQERMQGIEYALTMEYVHIQNGRSILNCDMPHEITMPFIDGSPNKLKKL